MKDLNNIDEYIKNFAPEVRKKLNSIRALVKEIAPVADEVIKYGMPTFVLNGNLVHFAAFKSHIGLYPTPSGVAAFKKELAGYKMSKGAIRFPLDKDLPLLIIEKIIRLRVAENIAKNKNKTVWK